MNETESMSSASSNSVSATESDSNSFSAAGSAAGSMAPAGVPVATAAPDSAFEATPQAQNGDEFASPTQSASPTEVPHLRVVTSSEATPVSAEPDSKGGSAPESALAMSAESGSTDSETTHPSSPEAGGAAAEAGEPMKKARAPRTPKPPVAKTETSSVGVIVERVVRLTALDPAHADALGRLFAVALPEDNIVRLTRLTTTSLGPVGNAAAEALATVVNLESANQIHVGVQLGRLAPTALPDVYRCAHALTGEQAGPLPKGDNAVFAVADALATLTAAEFAVARALAAALA